MAGFFNWFKRDEEPNRQDPAMQHAFAEQEAFAQSPVYPVNAFEQAGTHDPHAQVHHDTYEQARPFDDAEQQPMSPEPAASEPVEPVEFAASIDETQPSVPQPEPIAAVNPRPRDRSRDTARHVGGAFVDELPIGESGRRPELRDPDDDTASHDEPRGEDTAVAAVFDDTAYDDGPSSEDAAFAAAFDDAAVAAAYEDSAESQHAASPSPASEHPDAETPSTEPNIGADPATEGTSPMAQLDQTVNELLSIDGATGAAIVDIDSGMALAFGGAPGFDLSVAAAGNSNVVRAKMTTMRDIGLTGEIEDIMITLNAQYHLINILASEGTAGLFIYLTLDRAKANLALARHKLKQVAKQVSV